MGAKERRLLFGLEFSVISAFQCFSPFDLHWDWMDNFPKCLWTLSLMHSSFGPYPPRTGWGWVGFDSHTRVSGCRNGQNVSRKKAPHQFLGFQGFKHPGWKCGSWKLPGKQWTFFSLVQRSCCQFSKLWLHSDSLCPPSFLLSDIARNCPNDWSAGRIMEPNVGSSKKISMIYSSVLFFEGRILIPSTSYPLTRSVSTNEHVHFRDGYAASTVAFMVLGLFLPPGKCCTTPERFTRK